MDESFLPFNKIIEKMVDIDGEIYDDKNGIHSYIYEFEIDSPVEMEVITGENLQIASVPPMYYVDTSFRPSYHRIRFTAEKIKT
jgi:hypothetical protein